ncbi:hypothetical protein GUJ93_ZPchr0013g35429 [Zizania palustris]|uniref:Uncharacterized protein n=1 Tax=Zizania palustris TaxID=103762 RepID=A0A8J5X8Z9_ZIZPA|nr:hypothetical protein GUJ93_ZPchr0013g35429 [Zizania palustris]
MADAANNRRDAPGAASIDDAFRVVTTLLRLLRKNREERWQEDKKIQERKTSIEERIHDSNEKLACSSKDDIL